MCVCACVRACVRACVSERGIQYYDYKYCHFGSFNVYIIVDLVKRSVLIPVGEIRRYRK